MARATTKIATDTSRAELFDELVRSRQSCRAFLPDEVPEEVIGTILETAQQAPSWCNAQPWQVIVTAGEGTARFREEMFRYASTHPTPSSDFPFPREYVGEYLQRRRESGFQLYSAVGVERGNREAAVRQGLAAIRPSGLPGYGPDRSVIKLTFIS